MAFFKNTLLILGIVMSSGVTAFELKSTDIHEGQRMSERFVYNGFGCTGKNESPQLSWSHAPSGTKSFALTVHDPDAPTSSGWWHWSVINIPAKVTRLTRGIDVRKLGAAGIKNDFGSTNFGGACPPKGSGMHRYVFTLWALPTTRLDVPKGASPALVSFTLGATALGKAVLTSTYSR